MLKHLFIKNYTLIDELNLDFAQGFTTITGETGAGKSILLGGLKLVLGERADLKALKNSEEKCVIEAEFDISNLGLQSFFLENDLDYEPLSILRRDILPSGKTRAFVNDVPTTLSVISELSNHLIDVHSQFDSANIITAEFQFDWLDTLANQLKLREEYQTLLSEFHQTEIKLKEFILQQETWEKERELNEFIFTELDSIAGLENIVLEDLEAELNRLENAEQIIQNLSQMDVLISGEPGIEQLLNELFMKIKEVSTYFKLGQEIQSRIENVKIEINELSRDISHSADDIEPNPELQQEIKEKINKVNALLQKHKKNDIAELVDYKNELSEKLLQAAESNENIQRLDNKRVELLQQLESLSEILIEGRKKVIPNVENEILESLKKMGMGKSRISIQIERISHFNQYGKNQIQFLFSANPGLELTPIEKSVSGGERSRLVLAIKKSLSRYRSLPTLILDEVDTGVSGKIAGQMGQMMKEMSQDLQVIAITHLPQVAALGEQHLKVEKKISGEKTTTNVSKLSDNERLNEIAQMISGDEISKAALNQARELIS